MSRFRLPFRAGDGGDEDRSLRCTREMLICSIHIHAASAIHIDATGGVR